MTFDSQDGTRGARQPAGKLMRRMNAMAAERLKKKGSFAGMSALVLTTIGSKSGLPRETPVGWFAEPDGSWLIVASANGAAKNPAWYHNLAAHPDEASITIDRVTIPVSARQLHGDEREVAWTRIVAEAPRFGTYVDKTDRVLPVIRLTRRDAPR